MYIQNLTVPFFAMIFCIIFFGALLTTGAVSAALVAEWNEHGVLDKKMSLSPQIALPLFDATKIEGNTAARCGDAPSFPVGIQTLVKIQIVGGAEREFVLYIPQTYTQRNGSAVALQLLFHGLNDRCDSFLNATGFVPLAEKDGYILASLCGSFGLLGRGWNSGTCCGFFSPNSPDDFDFALRVVDIVATGACVDREKVMAVGFSNGAMMAEVLGCREPTVFRVIASVAGVVELRPGNDEGLQACARDIVANNTGGRRPSVLLIHGNLDILVPVVGNKLLGFPSLRDNIANWAKINGCDGNVNVTIATKRYRNEIYEHCNSAAGVSQTFIHNIFNRLNDAVSRYFWFGFSGDLHLSIVEAVHALYGGHSWFSDEEFNTTDYIYEFGKRVFSGY